MNVTEYIASGVLEDYCLGMLTLQEAEAVDQNAALYADIKQALDTNMRALEEYALSYERHPAEGTREKILAIIDNLEKEEHATLDALPVLNRYSSHQKWLNNIKPLLPPSIDKDIYVKVLRNDKSVFQAVLWLKSFYPDEVHDNVQESALLLEGECTCYIGDAEIKLRPGNFLEIPFNVNHNIKVTSGPVLAIIQRLKVA